MNIFITGIAGFLGSHLAEHFSSTGHSVYGCDSLIGGDPENAPRSAQLHWGERRCEDLERDNLRFVPSGRFSDIRRPKRCDVLYHCAALAHEGLSVFSPALISQNIYGASAAVFSAAIQAGVKRIVFCSSMARYGDGHLPPFHEQGPCYPVDPYGVSKLAAERLLAVLAEAHGFEYVIAIPHNIIGPRQKFDDPFRNVASIMVNRMLQGQPPIIYGDGRQTRCFSFVQDCVESLALMATAPVSGEVINIGPDQGMITINELARTLMDLTGFEGGPVYMPGRPQEVKEAWCSSDKARRLLGFDAKTPLRDGLQSIVEHIRQRGPKPFNYHLPVEIVKGAPKTWTERLI